MRKILAILIPVLLLTAIAQFTACEKYVLPAISVTPDTLYFQSAADSALVNLSTNVITKPEADDDDWISAWPDWFDADSPLTIYVKENRTYNARIGILYFKSESLQRKLVVIQAAAAEKTE